MLNGQPVSEQPNLLLCCFDVIPGPSGLSRRVTEYLKGMSERYQVVVLSAKTPDVSHIERYQGARLLRVPVGTGDLASRIQAFDRAVRRQMESEEFAIVHCFDPFGGYPLCELKNDYGYRFIYDASSFPSQELRWSHPDTENDRRFLARIRRQELYCLMNADQVITGSEATRRYITSLGVPVETITVIPAPVDLSPYTQAAMGRPDASPMKLIYLGSQLGYQGLTTLLRALQLALRQTDVRLTVVGPRHPEWQPPLEDLIEDLKLKGKVEFQPPVGHDDVHKIVALADAGVAPLDPVERNTVQGGALSKVAEYLAGGRPVIASDLEVARELIPEGAGAFFPPGDYKALAEVLVSLGTHPEQRVAMGAAASKQAPARFDGAKARTRLVELYEKLQLAASQQVDDRGEPTRSAIKAMKAIAAEKGRASGSGPVKVEIEEKPTIPVDDRATTAITDPASSGKTEPPVVMGLPLRDEAAPSVTAPELEPVTPRPAPRRSPPPRPPLGASGPIPTGSQARLANPLGVAPLPPSGSKVAIPRAPVSLGGGPLPASGSQPRPPAAIPSSSQARVQNPLQPAPAPARPAAPLASSPPVPTASQARAQNPLAPPVGRVAVPLASSPPIPTASQARAQNPLFSPPPIPTGSQARASNPLLSPPPIPAGSQARASNPLAAAQPIPSGSQGKARGPLAAPASPASGSQGKAGSPLGAAAPSPSGSAARLPRPTDLQPGSEGAQTDRRIVVGTLEEDQPDEGPEEVSDDAVMALSDTGEDEPLEEAEPDEVLGDEPLIAPSRTLGDAGSTLEDQDEEPPEAEADADLEADSHELESVSALDPWLAQLVHGWCPPDAGLFNRLPPPTTFPGRENPPHPSRP